MHWRHVSITTTPCWGSKLVALRAHVLLAERIGAHPLSQCAHPGQLGGEACKGLPSECMLGDGARGVPRLTPNTTGAPFCDVICIWSIVLKIACKRDYNYVFKSFKDQLARCVNSNVWLILSFCCVLGSKLFSLFFWFCSKLMYKLMYMHSVLFRLTDVCSLPNMPSLPSNKNIAGG